MDDDDCVLDKNEGSGKLQRRAGHCQEVQGEEPATELFYPGQLGPGAQFATFSGRTVGPRSHFEFEVIFS